MISREANAILKISIEKDLETKVWEKWLHDNSEEDFKTYFDNIKNPNKNVDFEEIRKKSKSIERRMKENGII